MIRKLIKEQLEKCNFVKLDNYDEKTHTYLIKKYSKPKYELNKCYLIKIPPYLVNSGTSILATNWNNGTSPSAECLKVFVSKVLGKMIYVDSLVFDQATNQDTNTMWSGWLAIDELTQLASL